ncbi:MAG: hypothetical protein AB1571_04385, partial [Nanoarchaeota archaeon]
MGYDNLKLFFALLDLAEKERKRKRRLCQSCLWKEAKFYVKTFPIEMRDDKIIMKEEIRYL